MIKSISETILAITAELSDLDRALQNAKGLLDLEAVEGLVALTKLHGQVKKTSLRLKAAVSKGDGGPSLFDGQEDGSPA
jgi:hypothetical protein